MIVGQVGQPPSVMMCSALRSASAAIISDGFAVAVLPGIRAPSTTYSPGCPVTRPNSSVATPSTAPPRGCAVYHVNPAMGIGIGTGDTPDRSAILALTSLATAAMLALPSSGQDRPSSSVAES